jgi:hypothetical protein
MMGIQLLSQLTCEMNQVSVFVSAFLSSIGTGNDGNLGFVLSQRDESGEWICERCLEQ